MSSRKHKLRKRRIGSVSLRIAGLTSDLLGYKLVKADAAFMLAVFAVVLLHGCFGVFSQNFAARFLGAVFCAIIYLIFKQLLPLVLFVRIVDILRFRYAFYVLCAAGALTVESSAAFREFFATVNLHSVCLTFGAAAVLANMVFMRYGGRMLLVGSYLIIGGLCACGVIGVVTMVLAWAARYVMVYKLRHSFAILMEDDEGGNADYLIGTKVILRNSGMARHCRISCALMFLLGLGLMLFFRMVAAGAGTSHSVVLKDAFGVLGAELKQLASVDAMVAILGAVAMLVISLSFIRQATDVFERLKGRLMLVFATILGVSLGWSVGIVERLPPFSGMVVHSIIPDVLIAYALVLSGSVFLIELGCRELSAINSGYTLSASPELLSRHTRSLRVMAFAASIIAIVVLIPFILH